MVQVYLLTRCGFEVKMLEFIKFLMRDTCSKTQGLYIRYVKLLRRLQSASDDKVVWIV